MIDLGHKITLHLFILVSSHLAENFIRRVTGRDVQIHLQDLFQDMVKNIGRVKTSAKRYNTGKTQE